jgi:hypothetical protein
LSVEVKICIAPLHMKGEGRYMMFEV